MASGTERALSLIKGLDEQRDTETRDEVYRSIIRGYLNTGKDRKLRIMVVGEAGQGKSTLINALIGKEVAREGDAFDAGTNEVKPYFFTQNGVKVEIWDTPGFGMGPEEEDKEIVQQLKKTNCQQLDLTLFCIRMDNTRIPNRIISESIKKLTEVFHKDFWKHTLFVLTFANNVQQLCPQSEAIEIFFSQRCETIEDRLRGVLQDQQVGLSDEELAHVRVVPVGSSKKGAHRSNPWALPDREDWFLSFWMDISDHMHSSALSALLQANYHRLEAIPADDNASSQTTSFCPPSSHQLKPHERPVGATPEEWSVITQEIKRNENDTALEDASINASIVSRELGTLPGLQTSLCDSTELLVGKSVSVEGSPAVHTTADSKETDVSHGSPSHLLPNAACSSTTEPVIEASIHDRKIPIYEILKHQLKKENSGFLVYLMRFAKERGSEVKVFGHVGGFIEGAIAYLTRNKKKK